MLDHQPRSGQRQRVYKTPVSGMSVRPHPPRRSRHVTAVRDRTTFISKRLELAGSMYSPSSSDPDASVEIRRILARRRRIEHPADNKKIAREAFLKDHTFIPYASNRMVALQLPWFQGGEESTKPATGRAVRRRRAAPYTLEGSPNRVRRTEAFVTLRTDEAREILRSQGVDQLRSGHPTLMALALSQMESDGASMCDGALSDCTEGEGCREERHLDHSLWRGRTRSEPDFDMDEWIHMEMLDEEDEARRAGWHHHSLAPTSEMAFLEGWEVNAGGSSSRSSTPGLSSGSSTTSQESEESQEMNVSLVGNEAPSPRVMCVQR